MRLEYLYPQICNLFGDSFNVRYLASCSKEIEVVETSLTDVPIFVTEAVDMIYLGPMSEHSQTLVIKALMPYKDRISELIANGTVFLCTGNAYEVFSQYIETDEGEKIEGISIFPTYCVRKMMKRHNSHFLGKFEDIDIVGFKSQFSQMYGDNSNCGFLNVHKGIGINPDSRIEGIRKNNFFGTYLLGPLLILNPLFCEYLLNKLSVKDYELPFKKSLCDAYDKRVEEFLAL